MFLPFDSIPVVWVVHDRSLTVSPEGSDMIIHVILSGHTETNGPLCLCVYMLVHTPSYQQEPHTQTC